MFRVALKAALGLLLVSASAVAYADTIQETFTVSNTTAETAIASTPFSQFDPSLGTLSSFTITLSGEAATTGNADALTEVYTSSDSTLAIPGSGSGSPGTSGSFAISFSGEMTAVGPYATAYEGTGTQGVTLEFLAGTTVSVTNGTVTYNYTPFTTAAATPEPSTFALLGTGILGLAGRVRRRV